jgi:acyl-phosphate glycerol 3-phosphate acyltransferase
MIILWTAAAWLSGSLMFSYWLGRAARKNLKEVGDGNPGAVNLWQAAGYKFGIAGVALDFLKGYLPLFLLLKYGQARIDDVRIVPVAIAPIVGHAFTPFLGGRGGKAIAVTFGVWSALTDFAASLAYAVIQAVLLAASRALNQGKPGSAEADGFQVVLGLLPVGAFLLVRAYPLPLLWVWLGNFGLLAYTHRRELRSFLRSRRKWHGSYRGRRDPDDRFRA